jgi:hypothetical protein
MKNQNYPDLNLTILRRLGENWGERFPPIDQVTLSRCEGYDSAYALIVSVDETTWHTLKRKEAEDKTKDDPWPEPSDELLSIWDFFNWQAGGESCAHIEEELAAAYLNPPKNHSLPDGWFWLVQPAGAELPTEFLSPGHEPEVLFDRNPTVTPSVGEVTPGSDAPNIFRLVGAQAWEVRFNGSPPGKPLTVTKYKGHGVLRAVLAKPHTLTTYHEIQIALGENVTEIKQGPLETITPENLARMRQQKGKLREKLDYLDVMGQEESKEAETIRKEIADLDEEWGKGTWQGRPKLSGGHRNNKRRIDNQVKRALNDIGLRKIPGLLEHLEKHVLKNRTTEGITYTGDVEWLVD